MFTYHVFLWLHQVVTQFKNSLVGLTEILMCKEPWYVRCIKPNESKQPGKGLYTCTFSDVFSVSLVEMTYSASCRAL